MSTIADRPSGLGTSSSTAPASATGTGSPRGLPVAASSVTSARAGDQDDRPAAVEERRRPTGHRRCDHSRSPVSSSIEPRDAVVADDEHARPCRIDVHPDHGMPGRDDGADARPHRARAAKRVLRPGRRLDPRRLERELDPELGVAVRARRARSRRAGRSAPSAPGRAPRCAGRTRRPRAPSLPRGRRARRKRETRAAGGADAPRPSRARPRAPRRDGSSSRAPHRRGRRGRSPSARLVRPQDPVLGKDADDTAHVVLRAVRELREVGRLVGDLRPRGSDEVIEEQRRDVPLLGRQRLDRPLEVVGDDLAGAAEPGERRGPERRRALERSTSHSRCITSCRYGASIPGARPFASGVPRPPGPSSMRPAPTPSSTSSTSSSSIAHGVPLELAPALERLHDRRAPGRAVEAIETQDVRRTGSGSRPSAGRATRACPPAARAAR